jgi:hypothetical protein
MCLTVVIIIIIIAISLVFLLFLGHSRLNFAESKLKLQHFSTASYKILSLLAARLCKCNLFATVISVSDETGSV